MWIAVSGYYRGAELEGVGGAQWIIHDYAFSMVSRSRSIFDLNPSYGGISDVKYRLFAQLG